MPTPREGETRDDYIGRCMGHPHMAKYDREQRLAVCFSRWERAAKAAGDPWLSVGEVAGLCPPCGEAMRKRHIVAIRLSALKGVVDQIAAQQIGSGLIEDFEPISRNPEDFRRRCAAALAREGASPEAATGVCKALATVVRKRIGERVIRRPLGGLRIKANGAEHRLIEFIASQEFVDRDGDVIKVSGINVANYMRAPVLAIDHDLTKILGRTLELTKTVRDGVPALVGRAEILPVGLSPVADQAWGEVVSGARAGISVGFLPVDIGEATLPGQRGKTFRRSELLAISVVAVPSCATCTLTPVSKCFMHRDGILIGDELVSRKDLTVLLREAAREIKRLTGVLD